MKGYLHRLLEILPFLTKGNFKKFNIISKYFLIFSNIPPASCVAHIAMDFITLSCIFPLVLPSYRNVINISFKNKEKKHKNRN